MKAIRTETLTPAQLLLMGETEKHWVYNGLDCCLTDEIFRAIEPQLNNQTRSTYEFEKELQAPVLEMKLRGLLVDQNRRAKITKAFQEQVDILTVNLSRIIKDGIGREINWRSNQQLQELLYGVLRIPPVKKKSKAKGMFVPTVDRDALERLQAYFIAQPIISHILKLRDISKKIGVLKTDIDPDGRMRANFNIAGTSTGRFSSSLSDYGTGTNLQNIEDMLRSVFVADPGYKFAYIDLEQAESRLVGAIEWNLFHDELGAKTAGAYLDACESGDLHTTVCRLAWGDTLAWTGELGPDKKLAEQPFYRQHSYRHMAKVLGHGTNYNGKPFTMAQHTKLEQQIIAQFQLKYFRAFPCHQRWHGWVAGQLLREGYLDTITGRRRWFFGRRDDDETVREAIAYDPQGSVGDILNRGMLQVWRANRVQLLLQIHDAILVQYPEHLEDEVVPDLLRLIKVPVPLNHGRVLLIPSEAMTGWNWGKASNDNPDGLKVYKSSDGRKRTEQPETSQLSRLLA